MDNTQQVIEYTKVIAIFDGWIEKDNYYKGRFWKFDEEGFIEDEKHLDQMKYHSSGDWLLPVVDKIQKIASMSMNENQVWTVWYEGEEIASVCGLGLINNCFKACYIFIEWYNQNTLQK